MRYDVVVIGAGVTGAFIARELSRYHLNVCLLEKEPDVAMGTSKANSAIIHAGYDSSPGSLKAILNVRGNQLMDPIAKELDVPFKRTGSLVLCFSDSDLPRLHELKERGLENRVPELEILSPDTLRKMEPNISQNVTAALYARSAGITCPYELTLHAAENAAQNGVIINLNCKVTNIRFLDDLFHLSTPLGEIASRYLVNAAGLYSDEISRMAGDSSFSIHPRRGEYALMDKKYGTLVNRVIFQLPSEKGKGILVTPTVDGNLLIGPNAEELPDKNNTETTTKGLEEVLKTAALSVKTLDTRGIITSFAGLRAGTSEGDFIIRASDKNSKLIHAAGIESPGLTAAPAIGEMVVDLLKKQGLILIEKTDFNPFLTQRKKSFQLTEDELNELIRKDPAYGKIVCRCEKVTEGDVIACIRQTIGATDLDGVKRRTRAGMGRCQGGFCSPRIVELLSKELHISIDEVTKSGGRSKLLAGKTK